ncbi:MAG TPA: ATP-binding cassette domain-containing protein [Burkholderiaceae bacterium]|nr:ATP-binding cassette domain-containing protein [Burkholderiaceae bacterium]
MTVRIEGLRHQFASAGGGATLEIDKFELAQSEHAVVIGPSGSGKTTLLSLMAGLTDVRDGVIEIAGRDLATMPAAERDRFRAAQIGLIPQQPHLFGALTAIENVLAALYFAGQPSEPEFALELLASLGLAGLERRRPSQLSRGQQQRVAAARALINRPTVILADEPTANLDDAQAEQTLELLRARAREAGATLVIATHDARARAGVPKVLALEMPSELAAPNPATTQPMRRRAAR